MQIETLDSRTLTEPDARAIGELLVSVWQNPEKPLEVRTQQLLAMGQDYTGPDAQAPRSFLIREAERVIAHSAIVPRTIGTSAGDLTIAGLASVCTSPEKRGHGLGELIAQAVFDVVDSGVFPFALFQTSPPVQTFYEKLGACLVKNKIINSYSDEPQKMPFKDEIIMRYPSGEGWPNGEIDLRGPGY